MRELVKSRSPESYSENSFWQKLAMFGRVAGYEVVEKALWLYYAADRPDTPKWAKAAVYGALAYFVLPADVVADVIPIAGYTDDLTVLVLALTTIGGYVDARVKEKSARTLARWFPVSG